MNQTSNLKKLILFLFLIKQIINKPQGTYLDSKKLPKLIEKYEYSIVLLYEEWCHFSHDAVKVFKQLMIEQDLQDTNIIFGFFDLKKEDEYKKFNSIKEIPEIHLYIKKTQIKYHGQIEKNELKNFLIEKLQLDNIQQIDNIEEINQIKLSDKPFFLFYGQKESPRYHVFLEGHYSFLKVKFVFTDNTLIGSKLEFENNSIYYYNQNEQKFFKYKKAYKRKSFMQWVHILQRKSIFEIEKNDFYSFVAKNKKPYLIVFASEDDKSKQYIDMLHQNQEVYLEYFQAVICKDQNEYCSEFKRNLYFDPINPSMYIMTFHKDVRQPLFYAFENNSNGDFIQFITNFQKGKRQYTIFSQDIRQKPDYSINKESQIVTRNYFKDFLLSNLDKDVIILFIDLKSKNSIDLLQKYQEFTKMLLLDEENQKNIAFGYYDITKNSCEVFKISDTVAEIKIYKQASLENQLQFIIDPQSQNFQEEFLDQLDSRTTHRINIKDEITENN